MCVERENPLYIYNRHSKLAAISPPAQGGGLGALSLIIRRFPGPGVVPAPRKTPLRGPERLVPA